jgi:hypothetical protein
MTWKSLDWIDVQIWEYDNALNDRVREAYLAAYTVLQKSYLARKLTGEEITSFRCTVSRRSRVMCQLFAHPFG